MSDERPWFTLAETAERLHVSVRHARRLVKPFDGQCHLGRCGKNPRLVRWVPQSVLVRLLREREWYAAGS